MIRLQTLLPVDGVVATGAVRAAYPDLNKQKTKRWMKPGVLLFTGILVFIVNPILKNKVKLIDQRATQYSKLTSPRCESPSGPLVSGLTMMTLTPGRILEENIWREISFRDYTTASVSSLRLWSECASHTQVFLVNNQYLQCLTPWVEDSAALLVPPASPWGKWTKDGL